LRRQRRVQNIDPAPFVDGATGKVHLYLSTGHDASGAWNRKASVIPLAADHIRASGNRRALFCAIRSRTDGGDWMVYHGRAVADGTRTLRIDPLVWNAAYLPARVSVRGPTTTPQQAP
jgi:hypothetical protein